VSIDAQAQLKIYRDLLIETRDFFSGKFRHSSQSKDLIDRIRFELDKEAVDLQYDQAGLS
jgi:hypothetical protein